MEQRDRRLPVDFAYAVLLLRSQSTCKKVHTRNSIARPKNVPKRMPFEYQRARRTEWKVSLREVPQSTNVRANGVKKIEAGIGRRHRVTPEGTSFEAGATVRLRKTASKTGNDGNCLLPTGLEAGTISNQSIGIAFVFRRILLENFRYSYCMELC